jgi:hypothetical protein
MYLPKRVLKQRAYLELLAKGKPKLRKVILQQADRELLESLREICINILRGSISLNPKQRAQLYRHRKLLRDISKTKQQKILRQKLIRQKGGFLPFLLPLVPALIAAGKAAALGAVGGTVSYGVKKILDR